MNPWSFFFIGYVFSQPPAFKCCRICAHVGYGNEFVNGHLCVHSQWHNHHHFSKKGGNIYCKKFIYTDVKIDKFKRQD